MKQRNIVKNLLIDRSTYGDSPLHSAIRYGQKEIVNYIVMLISTVQDSKKLVNIQNSSGKVSVFFQTNLRTRSHKKHLYI